MTRKQVGILVTLLLGVFMGALDIFIVAPALGAIQAGLHISPRLITWSFTAYTLVMVVTQPLTASLSDRAGRRWVYVACVLLFGGGSALCALAHSFAAFIIRRCAQAAGAGGVIPVASAVIADVFPEEQRGAALGIVGSVFGLAFILGPIIGATLTQGIPLGHSVTDWHAIFLVNLPLAVVISLLAARLLPAQSRRPARQPFDWYGAILLAAALFFLVFGLTQLSFTSFAVNLTNEAALPFLLVGLFFLLAFWQQEQRSPAPIVDTRTLRRRQLIIALALSLAGGIVTTSIVYVPQMIENLYHLPPGAGGFYLVYVAVALTLGTPVVGRLIDRAGSRGVIRVGTLVSVAGMALLLVAGMNPAGVALALILIGFGLATFVGTPLRYIVVNESVPHRRAASLAALTVCSSLGQTIVLPLGGALIASALVGVHGASARDLATVTAIHHYYSLVLLILSGAVGLTFGLKTHTQELTDRRQRRRAAQREVAPPPSITAPSQQPAMSSR